jgi:predicted nucleic acid-binding protein
MTRSPVVFDANAVVYFIAGEIPEYFNRIATILDSVDCVVPIEVVAEVVYVLLIVTRK